MKRTIGGYACFLTVLAAFFSCSAQGNTTAPETGGQEYRVQELAEGGNAFALDLFAEISRDAGSDNVFFSPYSISAAMAMASAGASGETASQMAEVLRLSPSPEATGEAFMSLDSIISSHPREIRSGEAFQLSVSNGLWVNSGFQLLDSYIREVEEFYGAGVRDLDLSQDPEGSREVINDWVAEKTMQKILDLIPPGVLNADTRLVITNAVYFKASWAKPFDEAATSDADFHLSDGSIVTVPMMTQTDFFSYVETEGCSAVELGYAGGGTSMLLLLPNDDIEVFQENLTADMLQTIRSRMSSVNVRLTMPRFSFTRSLQLGRKLQDMGMTDAFSSAADFSGITGGRDLFISEVVHKAFVKVDEAGTEAAAATAVMMSITAMPGETLEFTADRPFIFMILNRETGTVLFMGRVMDPSA